MAPILIERHGFGHPFIEGSGWSFHLKDPLSNPLIDGGLIESDEEVIAISSCGVLGHLEDKVELVVELLDCSLSLSHGSEL